MDDDSFARLVYLTLLGAVIGGYFIVANRKRIGQMMRQAVLWGFIFIGAIVAVGLWDDVRTTVAPPRATVMENGRIEVPRAADGHYYLDLQINDEPVRFVIDTGASEIVLSRADAVRVGINPDGLHYWGEANTANGVVRTARVKLERVAVGGIEDRRVTAWVNGGEMEGSLLGMAYLQRFARIEIAGDRMYLQR